jgi:hypothetical protein
VVVLLAFGVFAGCSGDSTDPLVEGRVSYQDKALESGVLTFYPAQGRPITAVISSGGSYSCRLPPGEYRVAVTLGVSLPPGWKEGDPEPLQAITLPAEYGTRLRTPLTATVTADQSAPIDFELK